jgi:ABC-2 type transport system ATP-binding protein
MAYCPDVAEFDPWLTAREVLDLAAGLLGKRRAPGEIAAMLERIGLAEAANRRVGGFSRGMRSRLGIAAGLIGEPQLLITDEPAAALDPAGRWEIIDLLASLAGKVTVLISSHDLADVEQICEFVGVLAKGQLVYQGLLNDLLTLAAPTWRVVVRPPADRLVAALGAAWWVRTVRESAPGDFWLDISDPAEAEVQLPVLLAESGVRLVEVGRAETSLQDVFFRLTGTGPFRHLTPREP